MPGSARAPLKHWLFHWPSLVTSVLCVGAVLATADLRATDRIEAQRREVQRQLNEAQARLDLVVESTFSPAAGLVVLIRVDGDLSAERFGRHVEALQAERPQVRNVVAAPDDVVRLVHPLRGNEKVLGLDYRTVPAQWAQIEAARNARRSLIYAPVKLVQGGLGVIQRNPVFVHTPEGEQYWGSVSLVADLQRFMALAQLPEGDLQLGLFQQRPDGSPGEAIWGDTRLPAQETARVPVRLPGAQWLLLARPPRGWQIGRDWGDPAVLGVAAGGLLVCGLSFALGQRRRLLQLRNAELAREIEQRRLAHEEAEAARARYEGLVAMASDWLWEQDAQFRLTYLSKSEASVMGSLNTLLGLRRWEAPNLLPGPDWAAHRAQLERHEPFRDFEYSLLGPDRQVIHVSVSGAPVFDAQGQFCGYRGTGRDLTAIRAAELELRRSSEELGEAHDRLQALFDAALEVAIIATDADDRITVFNRGAERMLGWRDDEVLGSSPHRFHDPAEIEQRARELSARFGRPVAPDEVFVLPARGTGSETRLWTFRTCSGQALTVSLTVSEVRDRAGRLLGHLGIALDQSAQLAAQRAEREGAQRLQALLDSAIEVGIITVDLHGHVTLFSRGAERLLGCSAAEALGLQAREFHARDEIELEAQRLSAQQGRLVQRHEVFERQAAGLDGGHRRIWTYVRRDNGQHLRVSHTFTRLHDLQGQHIGYLAVVLDISEQLRAQDALAASNRRLQAVLDSAMDVGIVVVALDGRVELFNRGAEQLFGDRAAEVVGRNALMFHDAQELQRRADALSQELGRPVHKHELFTLNLDADGHSSLSHWVYVRKSGERVQGALRFNEMRDADGHPLAYLAICLDVSEQARAQAELEQLNAELEARVQARTAELRSAMQTLEQAQDELLRAEKMAALGSLVAGVAHELNTPIGNCLTAASTLEERSRDVHRAFEANSLRKSALAAFLSEAHGASELLLRGLRNAADLVSHFKQVSVDQTSEQRRRFRLNSLVEDVLSVLRPKLKHSQIELQTGIELAQDLDGYPGALGQLLTNLVLNAQLHAFEGVPKPQIWIEARALPDGELFELQVSDNGVGMSDEVRRRAFDPFFTTKMGQGGTGLGLNIVYNIATGVLGGQVELRSSPGQGTSFLFKLPLVAPHSRETADALRASA